MAISVTVPRLGWSMEEGTFVEWLKADGDTVRLGDPLFSLESDKSTETVEAIDAGVLRIPADGPRGGDKVRVGQVIAYLVAAGEALPVPPAAVLGAAGTASAPGMHIGEDERRPAASSAPVAPPTADAPRRRAVAPRARRLARRLGIDLAGVSGSGQNGRVRERDVQAAARAPAGRLIPHPAIRRTIAARMVAGVTVAAPVTLTVQVDATNLVGLREQFRGHAAATDDAIPSFTALLVKLTAAALRQHPLLQAQWRDDGLFVPDGVHIALAVDTEAGLLVPVIRAADRLTLREIAAQARDLTRLAREGKLLGEQMYGATFTISNLGMFGVDAFTPIIQLPQCAVLGVGRIVREPAVVDGGVVPRDRMTLSLTFDHRVVDGAPAARFLDTLRRAIEQPAPLLIP